MSQSEQYDHVLGEEFDDYEDRRRCSSCRTSPRRGSRTRCPPQRSTSNNADVYLIVLMVGLTAGILWLIYDPLYDIDMNGGTPHFSRAKHLKKMQKPPLLKRLWHVVMPSNSKRCKKSCRKNVDTAGRRKYATSSTSRPCAISLASAVFAFFSDALVAVDTTDK